MIAEKAADMIRNIDSVKALREKCANLWKDVFRMNRG
jgi:hypothetical protein